MQNKAKLDHCKNNFYSPYNDDVHETVFSWINGSHLRNFFWKLTENWEGYLNFLMISIELSDSNLNLLLFVQATILGISSIDCYYINGRPTSFPEHHHCKWCNVQYFMTNLNILILQLTKVEALIEWATNCALDGDAIFGSELSLLFASLSTLTMARKNKTPLINWK